MDQVFVAGLLSLAEILLWEEVLDFILVINDLSNDSPVVRALLALGTGL